MLNSFDPMLSLNFTPINFKRKETPTQGGSMLTLRIPSRRHLLIPFLINLPNIENRQDNW